MATTFGEMQAGRRRQQKGFGRCLWCLYVPKNHGTSGRTAFHSLDAAFILTPMHFLPVPLSSLSWCHTSLSVSSLSSFNGVECFLNGGAWKMYWSWKLHVMGLTEVQWHNEEQIHCDWPWGFGKWKKLLSCSLSLRDLRWQKRAPL